MKVNERRERESSGIDRQIKMEIFKYALTLKGLVWFTLKHSRGS